VAEQTLHFHRQRPGQDRVARLGLLLRRHRGPIIAIQWLVVAVYAGLVVIPAFLPLPPESAHIWDNLRLFAQFCFWGEPDGSVIDAEGCLWNAQWGAGRVARYDPQGRLMASYLAAAAHTSCPALGGEAGDQLMVTTARADLSREALAAQPLSGSLFGLRLPRPLAVPEPLFNDAA